VGIQNRLRVLTSLGLAVLVTGGGIIAASLLEDAARKFGPRNLIVVFAACAASVFAIDTMTETRAE
jgi:hypothetical protein